MDHLRSRVQNQADQRGETPISTKKIEISWVWQQAPVIPATQEAEAGELLEPGSLRPAWPTQPYKNCKLARHGGSRL